MENAVLGPTPHRLGGPPIWIGGMVRASLERVGRLYDGWFPNSPDPAKWREQWAQIQQIAREAGREPGKLTGAVYLTLTIDENKARAEERMNGFIESYYSRPAAEMRARQATYAGPAEGAAAWLRSWVGAGVSHLVLRFAGDHPQHLETISKLRTHIDAS
jgi:alkanesulfonate monooxygenase SsuD/methylene tetrahydromethanopterin reductase-like flavin-dependent oxidoreductase (luciferase family)